MSDLDREEMEIRLPTKLVESLRRFAEEQGLTIDEVMSRFLKHLQACMILGLPDEVERLTGIIPEDAEMGAERLAYLTQRDLR